MKSIQYIKLISFVLCPFFSWSQTPCYCKSPNSLNIFKVVYVLNGKVKDLDTNFKIRINDSNGLLCEVQAHSILVESAKSHEEYERFSSLIKLPVLKLDTTVNLIGEIEFKNKTLRWDANLWKNQDSLKFYDSFGLYVFEYTKPRKFPKMINASNLGKFRKAIKKPDKGEFPYVLIGWNLEEIMIELNQKK